MASELEELMHLCRRSMVNLGLGMYPHYFNIKSSPLHHDLSDALICSENSMIMAYPREFGKSTYCWLGLPTWNVMFRKYRYILFIADSIKKGQKQFLAPRSELTVHPLLRPMIDTISNDSASLFSYVIDGETYFIEVAGSHQNLRGARYREHRPDLIILDDIEKTENVSSKDQRDKLHEWFHADVLPLGQYARFFMIGTMLHEDCLLARLMQDPPTDALTGQPWDTRCYGVEDDRGNPTWPEKYDELWIERKRKDYIKSNQLYRFNTEYMNVAVGRDDRLFSPENVNFYNPMQLEAVRKDKLDIITTVDLGIKTGDNNDPSVVMTTAKDRNDNVWILDIVRRRMRKTQILDTIVEQFNTWNPRVVYVESVQGQEYVVQDLEDGKWRGDHQVRFERIDGKQIRMGKELRIQNIEDLFEQQRLYAPASAHWWVDFQLELTTFPRGKHDDMLDALAYAHMNHMKPNRIKYTRERLVAPSSLAF